MGLSVNQYTYLGDDEFDLNFALGYTSRTDVNCYVDRDIPIDVAFDWITNNRVRVDTTYLTEGDILVFTRTVSKTSLPVDLKQPGNLTRENVETAVLHSLYAYHELLDGRFGDLVEVTDAVYATVEEAVTFALNNFLFSADFKQDVVLSGTLDSAKPVQWTSDGYSINSGDAHFYVNNAPSEQVEVLVYHNGAVVWAATVEPSGAFTVNTTSEFVTVGGPFTIDATASKYTSGLDFALVLPAKHTTVLDFDTVLSDYVQTFNDARHP